MKDPISKQRSVLCLLLAALTLSSVTTGFTACSNTSSASEDSTKQDTAATTTAAPAESETTDERSAIKEVIPDGVDYNGYEFRIQTRDAEHHTKEVFAESENGETVNDSVYKRNRAVEEKLNISIVPILVTESPENFPSDELRKNVMAGNDYCDMALIHTILAGTLAADGLLYNWYDLPYVDFTKPWWNKSVADELTIDNRLYLAVGDMCLSAIDYTWCMVFNKSLAADYDLGDIYQTVSDGKWTVDTFYSMISEVSKDVNGDGAYDDNDLYGFTTHDNSAIVNWMFALDQKVTKMNADGIPELALNTDRMASIVNKVYDILYNGNHTYVVTDDYTTKLNTTHDHAVASLFADDQSLFAALRIYVINELRSMKSDFGIIPFPKYDETQETYYTHVDGHAPLICIPNNITDAERTSVILECLNAESYRTCVPAVYDVVLTEKYARDEMSVKMLDLILDGRTQNFGYVYEGSTGMQWSLTSLMKSKSTNFASYYQSHEKGALRAYQKIIDAHKNIE